MSSPKMTYSGSTNALSSNPFVGRLLRSPLVKLQSYSIEFHCPPTFEFQVSGRAIGLSWKGGWLWSIRLADCERLPDWLWWAHCFFFRPYAWPKARNWRL